MRIVFVGACERVLYAAKELREKGYEIIIIEKDEEKVKTLSEEIDCGWIRGDGSNPEILQETKPESVDFLFGFTDTDQTNILIGLLGKSLKFKEVVVIIRNTAFEKICQELGLENVFVPSQKIGNAIVGFIEKGETTEIRDYIKGDRDLFKLVIDEENTKPIKELDLPSSSEALGFYRDEQFHFVDEDSAFKKDDELILLIHKDDRKNLEKKFFGKKSFPKSHE